VFFFACGAEARVPVSVVLADLGSIRPIGSAPKEGMSSWLPDMGDQTEALCCEDEDSHRALQAWCVGLVMLGLVTSTSDQMDDFFFPYFNSYFKQHRASKMGLRHQLMFKAYNLAGALAHEAIGASMDNWQPGDKLSNVLRKLEAAEDSGQ
jgi:hypothetical protein